MEAEHDQVVDGQIQIQIQSSSNDWFRPILDNEGESSNVHDRLQMRKLLLPRVPAQLCREFNKKCYDPMVVSIGPYHHGKTELQSMEKFKIVLARQYVKEGTISRMPSEEEFAAAARKAKTYYTDEESTKKFNDGEFTKMMFLDGCFILQFMISGCVPPRKEEDQNQDELKMKSHDMAFVQRDLFLLENQLPFHILELLMRVKFEKTDEGLEMMGKFIQRTRAIHPSAVETQKKPPPHPAHLLDLKWAQLVGTKALGQDGRDPPRAEQKSLFHGVIGTLICLLRSSGWQGSTSGPPKVTVTRSDWYTYRYAQELRTAGIHFRPSTSDCFTDVKYVNEHYRAVLRLPPMTIDDSTQSSLLNLVAYEMSPCGPEVNWVISYLCFIDSLIDNVDDVKELRHKGILFNLLGSDQQVADLFNEIANDLVPNPVAYAGVKGQIEEHYKNKIKVWLADWLHTHFSSPWTLLASIAAIFALGLSCVQTYLAFFPRS